MSTMAMLKELTVLRAEMERQQAVIEGYKKDQAEGIAMQIASNSQITELRVEVERLEKIIELYRTANFAKAKEIERLSAELGDLPQAQAEMLAECKRLKADANRYQWLRAEHHVLTPLAHVVWKQAGDRNSSHWVNTTDLDSEIDAAMLPPGQQESM